MGEQWISCNLNRIVSVVLDHWDSGVTVIFSLVLSPIYILQPAFNFLNLRTKVKPG
jgi:hypothetical protein